MMIHLSVHLHLVGDGKCREVVEEMKMLIEEEVNQAPDAKTFAISLNTSKYFLAKHLFTDNIGDNLELLKGEQLEQM
jgi:hypothetical protein